MAGLHAQIPCQSGEFAASKPCAEQYWLRPLFRPSKVYHVEAGGAEGRFAEVVTHYTRNVHPRGEPRLHGEVVQRGFPEVLTNESTPEVNREQSGRLELAHWIASPDNPLTARVMVNRIWQHLFGVGLVTSPDNFGTTGRLPSNPALLDHLAQRFIAHQWSIKSMIREIMLIHVYQLSTDHDQTAYEHGTAGLLAQQRAGPVPRHHLPLPSHR